MRLESWAVKDDRDYVLEAHSPPISGEIASKRSGSKYYIQPRGPSQAYLSQ